MIAKIVHNDSIYYSPVFAVSTKYRKMKAVVFDSSFSQLIVIDVFKNNKYFMFFMDYDVDGFSINELGFKSYWDDRKIFKTVKNQKYTAQMLEEARVMLRRLNPREFTALKSRTDIEALEFNSGTFHDGYILGMKEKDGALEILFDTTWGSLIILRCRGVLENSLRVGEIFLYCDMTIEDDGTVELLFDLVITENTRTIRAKHIEFKPLFDKRTNIKKFEYSFSNNGLVVKSQNSGQSIEITTESLYVLDFKERNVIGYLQNDGEPYRGLIFCGDIVYGFWSSVFSARKARKIISRIQKFKEECEQHSLFFERHPWEEGIENTQIIGEIKEFIDNNELNGTFTITRDSIVWLVGRYRITYHFNYDEAYVLYDKLMFGRFYRNMTHRHIGISDIIADIEKNNKKFSKKLDS